MAIRMQQRRATSEQWGLANPVLGEGEIGWESDTNKFKIGDGINTWDDLAYFLDEDALGGSIDDYVPLTQKGVANGVATLDVQGKVPSTQLDIAEFAQDAVDSALTAGTGLTKTYNDNANTITVAVDTASIATRAYVDTAVSNLVDSAPAALDTLNELAAALSDDATFATTVTNAIAGKQDKVTGVSDTEIGYLDGVTSAIQTQLNNKQDVVANVSNTEIGYLDGVTSAIQTQLDGKQASLPSQTGNSGKFLSTNGTAVSWQTVPATTMSDTAPASPGVGDRWVKTTTWQEYIYFDGYWVEI